MVSIAAPLFPKLKSAFPGIYFPPVFIDIDWGFRKRLMSPFGAVIFHRREQKPTLVIAITIGDYLRRVLMAYFRNDHSLSRPFMRFGYAVAWVYLNETYDQIELWRDKSEDWISRAKSPEAAEDFKIGYAVALSRLELSELWELKEGWRDRIKSDHLAVGPTADDVLAELKLQTEGFPYMLDRGIFGRR